MDESINVASIFLIEYNLGAATEKKPGPPDTCALTSGTRNKKVDLMTSKPRVVH